MTTARSERHALDRPDGAEPRRFSRAEYHRMAETGVLAADERIELLWGSIMMMSPAGPRHSGVLNFLIHALTSRLSGRAVCSVQGPLAIGEYSEPEPDLMLLRPRPDYYRLEHPAPQDVMLLVEVSESSAAFDRGGKCRLYAAAGVPEYWVVDLTRGAIVVHRAPEGDAYRSVTEHGRGTAVAPQSFPECGLRVEDVLG